MIATYFVDLDMTLIDSRERYRLAGPEPERSKDVEAYNAWLNTVQSETTLAKDKLFYPVAYMIRGLLNNGHQVIFLTAREEFYRAVTQEVLNKQGLGHCQLLMRPQGNLEKSGDFKYNEMRKYRFNYPEEWIVIIDDDPDGILTKYQKEGNFTLIKTLIGG